MLIFRINNLLLAIKKFIFQFLESRQYTYWINCVSNYLGKIDSLRKCRKMFLKILKNSNWNLKAISTAKNHSKKGLQINWNPKNRCQKCSWSQNYRDKSEKGNPIWYSISKRLLSSFLKSGNNCKWLSDLISIKETTTSSFL